MKKIPQEYIVLFNAISDAEKDLLMIYQKLIFAQQTAEELYISDDGDGDEKASA